MTWLLLETGFAQKLNRFVREGSARDSDIEGRQAQEPCQHSQTFYNGMKNKMDMEIYGCEVVFICFQLYSVSASWTVPIMHNFTQSPMTYCDYLGDVCSRR